MKYKQGFTLVELIIYIGILASMVVGLVAFALSMTQARTKTYVGQNVQANVRMALDVITQKIHAAQSVNVGASTFDIDPGVLSLQIAGITTIISLDANDGRLQIKEGIAAPVYLTDHETQITNLVFKNLTQGSEREHIRFDISAQYNNPSSIDYSYSWSGNSAASVRQ